MSNKARWSLAAFVIVCLIALIYWPVHQAGFVWVDKICFYDNAWLRYGNGWTELIFHKFYDWTNYFRPVVIALFVFELRAFDVAPGPMHLVSVGIHLANTLLVGLLALGLCHNHGDTTKSRIFAAVSMLVYGLHPALVEPVVWISCQYELVVTFFMLLGLLVNAKVQASAFRAFGVAACFLLAACSKEAAVSFPLLLVLFDWMQSLSPYSEDSDRLTGRLRSLLRRQWLVYVCLLAAGIAYLALRYWGLGFLMQPKNVQTGSWFAHLQEASFIYVTYWRILIWPMFGLGPLHVIDAHQFATVSPELLAIDGAALALLSAGVHSAWKRQPVGCLIMAVTIALLPVLHIVPVAFDASLYHERYAMTAVAMACALLPRVMIGVTLSQRKLRAVSVAASTLALAWLGLAVVNIRVTLPLWSDETKLWLWVLRDHPESIEAKSHLLSTYIELNDHFHARQVADMLLNDKTACPMCMLNVANLALAEGDVARASEALGRVKETTSMQGEPRLVQGFILATGQLRELNNDPQGAEEAYRDAIAMEPLDPEAQMNLALLLARQRRAPEARRQADVALSMFAPDQRYNRRRSFEQTLDASSQPLKKPPQ